VIALAAALLVSLGALVSVTAAPALAQEADTARAVVDRPFVEGGQDDKPHLFDLAGRLAVGGYAEGHFRFLRADGVTEEQTFLARRFNVFFNSQISDFVRFGAELEIEEGGEEILLEFMTIDLAVHRALNLRGGMILVPLGRFNLAHDSPRNPFTDRPLVSTDLEGVALSEPGFGLFGLFPLGGPARVTYQLYAVNGFDEGVLEGDPAGTRIPAGRGNFEDNNNSPAVVGRLAWSPRQGIELGASAHSGAYNVYSADGLDVDERRDLTMWVLDAGATVGALELTGEAAFATIDVPAGLGPLFASSERGLYADAVLPFWRDRIATMTGSFFAAKLRLDYVDFDADLPGDDELRVSAGLNFHPTRDTAFKLDLFRGRTHDRFNNPADEFGVLFSAATYF
jgi:hypothetical protein